MGGEWGCPGQGSLTTPAPYPNPSGSPHPFGSPPTTPTAPATPATPTTPTLPPPTGKFPKSVCTSVNECVCHGIPDDRALEEGDILNIDVTVYLDGYHGDTSRMFYVGEW